MTNEKELREEIRTRLTYATNEDIFDDLERMCNSIVDLLHSHTKEVVKMAKKIVIENTPAHFTREYRDTDLMRDKICKSLASLEDNKK